MEREEATIDLTGSSPERERDPVDYGDVIITGSRAPGVYGSSLARRSPFEVTSESLSPFDMPGQLSTFPEPSHDYSTFPGYSYSGYLLGGERYLDEPSVTPVLSITPARTQTLSPLYGTAFRC